MAGFFDGYGKPMRVFSKIVDGAILNILFLLCCIPVITAGVGYSALYYASVKVLRREKGYMFREFMRGLKQNFAVSTLVWLIILAVGAFSLAGSYVVYKQFKGVVAALFLGLYFTILFLLVILSCYVFPAISRFSMGVKSAIIMSFQMAFRHIKYTVISVLLFAVFAGGIYIGLMRLPIILFFIPVCVCLLQSMYMENILHEYMRYVQGDTSQAEVWYDDGRHDSDDDNDGDREASDENADEDPDKAVHNSLDEDDPGNGDIDKDDHENERSGEKRRSAGSFDKDDDE